MDKRNWYFRQPVKENEFDAAFDDVEEGMRRVVKDLGLTGVVSGGSITEVGVLTYDIAEWTSHDALGRRTTYGGFVNFDITNDSSDPAVPNTPSSGNYRWVTLVARNGYQGSDSRTDGNGNPVRFNLDETISSSGDADPSNAGLLQKIQGAENSDPVAAARPAAGVNDTIIGDILINDTGAAERISYSRVPHVGKYMIQRYTSTDSYSQGQLVIWTEDGELYEALDEIAPGFFTPSEKTKWKVYRGSPVPSVWDNPVIVWRNAQRHPVTGIDHHGYPAGYLLTIDETWLDIAAGKTATGTGGWFGKWKYRINNNGGFAGTGLQLPGPGNYYNTYPWGPRLDMNVFGQSVNAVGVVESVQPLLVFENQSIVMDWAFSFQTGGGSGTPINSGSSWAMGLSFGTVVSSNALGAIRTGLADYDGCYFHYTDGDTNWGALSDPGAGGADSNTGVPFAMETPHFARIVILGSEGADDGVAQTQMFIDGVMVGGSTLISASHDFNAQYLSPFFRVTGSGGEVIVMNIGRVRIHTRLAGGGAFQG